MLTVDMGGEVERAFLDEAEMVVTEETVPPKEAAMEEMEETANKVLVETEGTEAMVLPQEEKEGLAEVDLKEMEPMEPTEKLDIKE
jgi:hypothetical protein